MRMDANKSIGYRLSLHYFIFCCSLSLPLILIFKYVGVLNYAGVQACLHQEFEGLKAERVSDHTDWVQCQSHFLFWALALGSSDWLTSANTGACCGSNLFCKCDLSTLYKMRSRNLQWSQTCTVVVQRSLDF